ncbi:hypothetical protein L916_11052 [Phytophthora nicotianae]|uniref:Uncharacterized protein n=1 Tax=Phytophthora nicotianae TaxID=4792 RepID=W2IUF2_PHYNI|nr:hypothetical protein L916_11052 [Phytophthora nicotianae]
MSGEDAGDMVEEYQQAYMTKEKGGLKHAISAMHSAISHILKFPSVAPDTGTDLPEHRSFLSSDTCWFVFPHKLVQYVENLHVQDESASEVEEDGEIGNVTGDDDEEDGSIHERLEALIASADENEVSSADMNGVTHTGSRMFRLNDGKMVVVTQSDSYWHRGKWFADYSPLEFEMIVDLLPRRDCKREPSSRGRPKRRGFDLSPSHPLAPHYQGFIRAKFKTPMLGGTPPPPLAKNGRSSPALSKYLLCWGLGNPKLAPDVSSHELIRLSARALFRKFQTYFLTQQHRAASCPIQQANLESCRVLPAARPSGDSWSALEKQTFRPVTQQVVKSVTTELDIDTVKQDPGWLDDMTILVTSNFDKAVLTGCTARLYAKRHRQLLFRWKRELKQDVSPELERMVYDKDANPELFAYFVAGAPGQVLDNNNDNVSWGVANGTSCRMHSLAWEDRLKRDQVRRIVDEARLITSDVIDLSFPPDFINIQLVKVDGDLRTDEDWPCENNLESEFVETTSGRSYKKSIIIPVGIAKNPQRKSTVKLGFGVLDKPVEMEFIQHAVDQAQSDVRV